VFLASNLTITNSRLKQQFGITVKVSYNLNMDNKIQLYIDDMKRRGVNDEIAAPKIDLWLWDKGLSIKPPIFRHFIVNATANATLAFVVFSFIRFICMEYLFKLIFPVVPSCSACESNYAVPIFSVLFGFYKAVTYHEIAKKLALPKWESYSPGNL
jgi:hypothetical protein